MKCPNCSYPKVAYTVKSHARTRENRLSGTSGTTRTDFTAECPKCHWKGEIR